MLFTDQCAQVGFSRDNLHNCAWCWNIGKGGGAQTLVDFQGEIPLNNSTLYTRTFPSMDAGCVTSSTHTSSGSFWHAIYKLRRKPFQGHERGVVDIHRGMA
ncbi:hypothetical protein HOY82DRAFT_602746 [Tuber indicum]|nr:hypothetical protein HOY82DRAFT_602746 [Tuber indicum]